MSTGTDQKLSFVAPKRPLDKVYYRPGVQSVVVAQGNPVAPTVVTVNLANPQSEFFFMDAQLSVDQTNWYDMGQEPYYFDVPHQQPFKRFAMLWSMTTSTISLQFIANDASYTIYYRLVGISLT